MAGTLTISTLSDGTNSTSSTNCIQGSAKAWVEFNGTGTPSILSSYNVSSITKVTTGVYNVNFGVAFADTNYSMMGTCKGIAATLQGSFSEAHDYSRTTTYIPVLCSNNTTGGSFDSSNVGVAVFR